MPWSRKKVVSELESAFVGLTVSKSQGFKTFKQLRLSADVHFPDGD
jgi:hypothetical protein